MKYSRASLTAHRGVLMVKFMCDLFGIEIVPADGGRCGGRCGGRMPPPGQRPQ